MPDLPSDSLIVTGGYFTMSTVSRYGVSGWVEDLPSLTEERSDHGCGSFIREDGTQVKVVCSMFAFDSRYLQVLLVAGGMDVRHIFLSSTEVLTVDSSAWTMTTPLPQTATGLKGVVLGGSLYMTGKFR